MAGPWEKYQQATPAAEGPWSRYAQPAPTPELPEALQPRPAAPTAERELTTWEKARPYVAPTIEAISAGGGALLGAPLGPAGMVGGAGLGYGIAKEALGLADVYLGGAAPRQGAAQVIEPLRNILEGATYEAGGQVAGRALSAGIGKIMDMRNIPEQKAAEIARNALGPDLDVVLNTLRAAPSDVSAAQATANINSPTWQALIQRATARDPRFLNALEQSQGEVSVNALANLAGGRTAADVRGTTEAARKAVSSITTPMRESALKRANLGQEVARLESMADDLGEQAATKVQEVRRLIELGDLATAAVRLRQIKADLPVGSAKLSVTPSGITEQWAKTAAPPRTQTGVAAEWGRNLYPGKLAEMADEWASKAATASLDLGQGARFAQAAADAMRSVGIKPLESAPLIQQLKTAAANPNLAGNDIALGALSQVADDIAKWTSSGGIIDAVALDAIRKNAVNAAVAKLRPGFDATAQRNAAASALTDIKPIITNAIEDAGGVGYRNYLAKHSQMMQKVAEKQLAGEALELWKTNKDAFVKLVQNESPEVVEKILGPGRYNIAVELADSTMDVLRAQAQKRLTELSMDKQISLGQDALRTLLLQNLSKFRVPSYLSAITTNTNQALKILEEKINQNTMRTLTKALQTPEGAVDLLKTLPASQRNQVLQLISRPDKWTAAARTGTTAAVVNALAPDSENNLAP